MRRSSAVLLALAFAALAVSPAWARPFAPTSGHEGKSKPSREVPGLDAIGVDEQLDKKLPLDLTFRNHEGRTVRLRDYFDAERPVLLIFAYYTCPVLCNMVLDATHRALREVPWTVGKEFEVVTISIDPQDTPERASQKRADVLRGYGRADLGWHFLVGDQENIRRATEAAGIRYFYNTGQEQYAHPATIMFLTPEGRFARYLYGLSYPPADARIALLEASKGRSISTVEQIILYCYSYDPEASSYTLVAWRVMRLGGGLVAVALGTLLFFLWRSEIRRRSRSRSGMGKPLPPDSHAQVELP